MFKNKETLHPESLGDQVFAGLPAALHDREDLRQLARGLAREYAHYSEGIVAMDHGRDADGLVRMLSEDIEVTRLLSDLLATEEDTGPELTPEERAEQIQAKAQEIQAKLGGGATLQKLIRDELADTDCGACDHPTCDLYSIALANGKDPDNTKCEPGGPKVTAQVELVMNVAKGESVDAEKIMSIEAKAKEEPKREGGLQVAEIGTGHGFPSIVLAYAYPEVDFEILEPDEKRAWLAKRIVNLLGCRNVKVRGGRLDSWASTHAEAFDVVLVKHLSPLEAVQAGVDFVRPGGLLIDFQTKEWAADASRYQSLGTGRRMPMQAPRYFSGKAIDRSVLILLRRPDEATPEADEPESNPPGSDDEAEAA